jgi:hypothetical protein
MNITRRNNELPRPLRPFIHRTFVQNTNVAVRKTLEANFCGIFRQMVWLALFDFQRIDDRNTVTRRRLTCRTFADLPAKPGDGSPGSLQQA